MHRQILALSAVLLFGVPVFAQSNQSRTVYNRATPGRVIRKPLKPKQNHELGAMKYEYLKKAPMELPAMSAVAPAGARYIMGMKNVSDAGVTRLQLRYNSPLDARGIMDFYGQQFKQPGWKINTASDKQMTASFGGNLCMIVSLPSSNQKFPRDVQITYSMAPSR